MARKTWIVVASMAILAIGVAACGSSNNNGGSTSTSSSAKKSYKMTLIAGVKGDEFYITMNCGAQAKAKELGVTLNFQGPDQFDASLQTPIVNAVAAKKPDAVLVAPTDTKAMYPSIKALSDAGTKVALVDTTLEQADFAVSQIASDNEGGGKAAATTLADLIGGSGKVFVVNVKPGISTTDLRAKGFQEGAKAAGLTYVGQQYDDDDPAKAASIVKAELAKNPDLKGIFAMNVVSGNGVTAAVKSAGKSGKVKLVEFDAGPEQVTALKSGTIDALVAQYPFGIGQLGVRLANRYITGKRAGIKKHYGTGSAIITRANVNKPQFKKFLYTK